MYGPQPISSSLAKEEARVGEYSLLYLTLLNIIWSIFSSALQPVVQLEVGAQILLMIVYVMSVFTMNGKKVMTIWKKWKE